MPDLDELVRSQQRVNRRKGSPIETVGFMANDTPEIGYGMVFGDEVEPGIDQGLFGLLFDRVIHHNVATVGAGWRSKGGHGSQAAPPFRISIISKR